MQYQITNNENDTVYTVETNKSESDLNKIARRMGRHNGAQMRDNVGEIWVEKAIHAGAIRDMLIVSTSTPARQSAPRSQREYCHYCGCVATGHDFYGAPICDGCR